MIALFQPGEAVTLDVIRYGQPLRMDVKLGEFAAVRAVSNAGDAAPAAKGSKLGFEAVALTPQIASQISANTTDGVVIYRVEPSSPAAAADLVPGYLVKSINGQEVRSVDQLNEIGKTLKPGQVVSLMLASPSGMQRILNYEVRS